MQGIGLDLSQFGLGHNQVSFILFHQGEIN